MDVVTMPLVVEGTGRISQEEAFVYEEHYDYYADYYLNATYEPVEYLPLDEIIPVAIVYSVIGLLGLVGNLLVIFAILRVPRMKSITNLFLLSLSSADLLLVLVCVPVKGITFYSYSWRLGEFMCKFVFYIQTVSMICSALTLTVMSIERFVAIRHPLRARSVCTIRHARIVIVSVWISSFILAIPIIFGIEYRTVGLIRTAHWCHKYWHHKPTFGKVFELYMLLIILAIPFSVMLVTYTWIANIIWHVATHRAGMRSGSCVSTASSGERPSLVTCQAEIKLKPPVVPFSTQKSAKEKSDKAYMDDDRTRKQVVMMLIVVVLMFTICWTPILINNVLVAFDKLDYLSTGYLKPMRIAFHLLSYANSCVNPFVYAFMSKTFRDGFKHAISACFRGNEYLRRRQMSARSMTSTTRASTSQAVDKTNYTNGQRSDSLPMRRPSDMEDADTKKLLI